MALLLPQLETLIKTVHAVTDGRLLNYAPRTDEADIAFVRFPVKHHLPGDPKDTAMRQFISDWLKLNTPKTFRLGVKHSFEPMEPGHVFWYEDETGRHEVPIVGALTFQLWEKAKDEDYENYLKEKKRRATEETGV